MHEKYVKEGNRGVPFFFYTMNKDEQISVITTLLDSMLTDDLFLVDVRIKPTNNIKVYIDADSGLSIERCTKVNRALYKQIEEKGLYPDGNFSLEVSSPGIDEPLKLHRQFIKNTGRVVDVLKKDDTKLCGKLIQVLENTIVLEHTEGKNKKAVTLQSEIPFDEIKSATVQIRF